MSVQFFEGIPVNIPNTIIKSNSDFHVSYNPSSANYGIDTTALYIKETSQYLILGGNHTKEYEGLSFEESLAYFYANINLAVEQSEHGMIFKLENGEFKYVKGGY